MTHLFVSREYPPAAYPPGGIGTYLRYITELLARAGETVHVIGHRWDGAPQIREESIGGRLIVHRVAMDDAAGDDWSRSARGRGELVPRALLASSFPSQAFAWQAALLAERLVDTEQIDVIEAQEWEAPLYYFQLRRTLNLGPVARPPCVIHLHSPTERIFEANHWDTGVADYLPAAAMEAFSIAAANRVLCPSRFLADQAIARYGLDPARLDVVPYPLGDVPHLDRPGEAWSQGSIFHIGRLEPRKGVLEWADALRLAAPDAPALRMEFVGADMPMAATGGPMVGRVLRAKLPQDLRRRVHFHGSRPRADFFAMLSHGWAAAVPSRWDNLPYSCIESMCTGLPIIASPNGGMCELIEDGVSGWIARDQTPEGLADALRRALATPAAERERMGQAAERAVRLICDNDRVVSQHLEIKQRIRASGSRRVVAHSSPSFGARRGVGVIATGPIDEASLTRWRSDLQRQSLTPAIVWPTNRSVVRREGGPDDDAAQTAVTEMVRLHPDLFAVALVDVRLRLEPHALAACLDVLASNDRVTAVSAWTFETGTRDGIRIPPGPAEPFVVVRADAAAVVGGMPIAPMVYPSVLGGMGVDPGRPTPPRVRYSSMARAVQRLHMPFMRWLLSSEPDERRAVIRGGLSDPARSVRWLVGRGKRALRAKRMGDPNG